MSYVGFFFFQAEDGIRDESVTGVQTCALPIELQSHSHLVCRLLEFDRKSTSLNSSYTLFSLPPRASLSLKKEKQQKQLEFVMGFPCLLLQTTSSKPFYLFVVFVS